MKTWSFSWEQQNIQGESQVWVLVGTESLFIKKKKEHSYITHGTDLGSKIISNKNTHGYFIHFQQHLVDPNHTLSLVLWNKGIICKVLVP